MRPSKVEQSQFRWIDQNTLTHIPTGAAFSWKYPGSGAMDVIIDWRHTADVLPGGELFDPCEIETLAVSSYTDASP